MGRARKSEEAKRENKIKKQRENYKKKTASEHKQREAEGKKRFAHLLAGKTAEEDVGSDVSDSEDVRVRSEDVCVRSEEVGSVMPGFVAVVRVNVFVNDSTRCV